MGFFDKFCTWRLSLPDFEILTFDIRTFVPTYHPSMINIPILYQKERKKERKEKKQQQQHFAQIRCFLPVFYHIKIHLICVNWAPSPVGKKKKNKIKQNKTKQKQSLYQNCTRKSTPKSRHIIIRIPCLCENPLPFTQNEPYME